MYKLITVKNSGRLMFSLLLVIAISATFLGCNPDEGTPPETKDSVPTTQEEYLIVNGVRYEGKDFFKKSYTKQSRFEQLQVQIGPNYPSLTLGHEKKQPDNVLIARDYLPSQVYGYEEDLDIYEVKFYFAYGAKPKHCQYIPPIYPVPHEKYSLKKVDGKWVSDFGKANLQCNNKPATGDDKITVEGYLIWENKN
jgi:hypothetical protein